MEDLLNDAIRTLTKLITEKVSADEALKYTQAANNLANVQRALGIVRG